MEGKAIFHIDTTWQAMLLPLLILATLIVWLTTRFRLSTSVVFVVLVVVWSYDVKILQAKLYYWLRCFLQHRSNRLEVV